MYMYMYTCTYHDTACTCTSTTISIQICTCIHTLHLHPHINIHVHVTYKHTNMLSTSSVVSTGCLWQLTLHSGGQFLSSGWVVSVVGLPALRTHPASVDEVTETVAMVLQPGLGNGRRLRGWPVGKGGQEGAYGGMRLN